MNNERNNRLILDNVPFVANTNDFTNPANVTLENISNHRENKKNSSKEDDGLSNVNNAESDFQD